MSIVTKMNLTPLLSQLEQGGLMLFAGGTNIFKAGPGALLSLEIEHETGQPYSHTAVLFPKSYWPSPDQPWIQESTKWQGVSGPQWNNLSTRLILDYEKAGGHAWLYQFLPPFVPDWSKAWAGAQQLIAAQKAGKLHYSVAHLFGDAVNRDWVFSLLPIAGILEHVSEDSAGIVCSEDAGMVFQDGGVADKAKAAGIPWLPTAKPIPGQAIGCSPGDLAAMPLYGQRITLL